jgi:hypothetical protein
VSEWETIERMVGGPPEEKMQTDESISSQIRLKDIGGHGEEVGMGPIKRIRIA